MSKSETYDYSEIYYGFEPSQGKLRLATTGIGWRGPDSTKPKDSKEDKIITIPSGDFRKMNWFRAARGFQLRIILKDGNVVKFDGFRKEMQEDLTKQVKHLYSLPLEPRDLSVKGWNWGVTSFDSSNLFFNVSNRAMFELPLNQAIGVNKLSKNEVNISFVDPGAKKNAEVGGGDELVDVTFYIPGTVAVDGEDKGSENEEDTEAAAADTVFYETVKSKLELNQVTSELIVQFNDVFALTPRGRYSIDLYADFFRLRGKSYDYKIPYKSFIKLFLLLKPDDTHVLFVVGLDPPLRRGQQKDAFLVFQFVRDDELECTLNLDEQTIAEKYKNKVAKVYDAPAYEVFSQIFHGLSGRKVTVSGQYHSHHSASAIKCSMKATEGLLYPLEKSILFVSKNTIFIPMAEINRIVYSRVGSASGGTRTFDLKFLLSNGTDHQFIGISREEHESLDSYFKSHHLKTHSESDEGLGMRYHLDDMDLDEDDGDEKPRRRKTISENVSMNDNEDEESPDEDFVANDSESEIAEEFDSDAESSGGEEEED